MAKETGLRERKYSRHWMILACLPEGTGGRRVDEIAREAECGVRTVYRDLNMLLAAGFPVEREKTARGTVWRLARGFRNFPPMPFSVNEAAALLVAERRLRAAGDTYFAQLVADMIAKLSQGRGADLARALARLDESFIGPGMILSQKGGAGLRADFYEMIARAIQNRLKVVIDYRDAAGRLTRGRMLAPIRLWIVEHRTYLLAHCYTRQDVRTFDLARFRRMAVTEHKFSADWDFDPESYVRATFDAFHADPELVELEFDGDLENYIRERPLHESQQVSIKDGRVSCRLFVGISEPLVHVLLGFGTRVRVFAPLRLRTLLAERHSSAATSHEQGIAPVKSADPVHARGFD